MNKKVLKDIYIFLIFGCIYITIEVYFKALIMLDVFGLSLIGYTSIWMFFVGGLSALMVGKINEYFSINIFIQSVLGALIITSIELISGLLFNIILFPNNPLWDYTNLPFNFKGQICIIFSIAWGLLCPCIIKLDDFFREHL